MLFISYGMQKSASSFAFQLAKDIANTKNSQWQLNQRLPEELRSIFIPNNFADNLKKLGEYIKDDEIYVVKTHCPLNYKVKEMIKEGHAKASVSIRNPYDIVVSLKDTGDRERAKEAGQQRKYFTEIKNYTDAVKLLPPIMKNASSWLDNKDLGVLVIPFTQISQNPLEVAQDIAKLMNVDTDVTELVESYTSNKQSILEFNVGQAGRGEKLLDLSEDNEITEDMDEFIKMYL